MDAYTYMLYCSDGSLYTGWTNDLQKRIDTHNKGKGSKYTRIRLPVKLVYYEHFCTKAAAMHREYEIKQLPREKKLDLCGRITDEKILNGTISAVK